MKKKLDWYDNMRLLAMIRSGDYAHAGETKAIDLVFSSITKNKHRQIVDLGSGLGGTAAYIEQSGFGKVSGLDLDATSITYAKDKYHDIEFYTGDAVDVDKLLPHHYYDLICAFNSFIEFKSILPVLNNLSVVAKPRAQLVIFDYIDLAAENSTTTLENYNLQATFTPIKIHKLEEMLKLTGWEIQQVKILDDEFIEWYRDLLAKINLQKDTIISEFNDEVYSKIVATYTHILNALNDKVIGGAAIYAEKTN